MKERPIEDTFAELFIQPTILYVTLFSGFLLGIAISYDLWLLCIVALVLFGIITFYWEAILKDDRLAIWAKDAYKEGRDEAIWSCALYLVMCRENKLAHELLNAHSPSVDCLTEKTNDFLINTECKKYIAKAKK